MTAVAFVRDGRHPLPESDQCIAAVHGKDPDIGCRAGKMAAAYPKDRRPETASIAIPVKIVLIFPGKKIKMLTRITDADFCG